MDRHYFKGLDWSGVQIAHEADLKLASKYDAHFLTYWFDEARSTTFCLVSAPSADSVIAVHGEAHGQIPNDIVEVDQASVQSFMGRFADIPPADQKDGRYVDRGIRTIMFTDLVGYTAVTTRLGDDRAIELLREHNNVVRDSLTKFGGREVKHTGDGVMASFDEADQAIGSAIEIRDGVNKIALPDVDRYLSIRIGMTAGEPIQEGEDLFGSVVNLAARLCDLAESSEILLDDEVRNELTDDSIALESIGEITIRGFDQPVVVSKVIG